MISRALWPLAAVLVLVATGSAFAQSDDKETTNPVDFALPSPFRTAMTDNEKTARPSSPWAPRLDAENAEETWPYGEPGAPFKEPLIPDYRKLLAPHFPEPKPSSQETPRLDSKNERLPGLDLPTSEENPFRQQNPTYQVPPASTLPTTTENPFRPSPAEAGSRLPAATARPLADRFPPSARYGPFSPSRSLGPFTPSGPSAAGAAQLPNRSVGPYGTAPSQRPGNANNRQQRGIGGWYDDPSNRAAVEHLRQQYRGRQPTYGRGY